MQISLQHIHKSFGPTPVLADISLEVQREELFFLLGPSGCGKTTLLRLIAGFYQPDRGEIYFDGRRMNDVPPHRRNTGMVFQNYALWPHLTVAENVSYGLAVRGLTRREQEVRVQQALDTVQLGALGQRTPNALSGGQQQRVALARALVIQPDVLLLDEPLSNLDAKLRLEMRDEIRRIHAQTRITTIYVTHDQKESLSLATRIAVMRDGRIDQIGTPRAIYRQPQTRFVAEFIGETNWLSGRIAASDSTSAHVETSSGPVHLQTSAGLPPGTKVWLGFRPESVQLNGKGGAAGSVFPATIESVTYLGEIEQYRLRLADGTLIRTVESNPVTLRNPGEALEVTVRPENFFMIQADVAV